ncbi:unnamed protein product [Microthlaspi erraticum]|uniref:Uncharacterized protein n=1 Tax=Microthlaspi erraticum TaxID=1685480 RepID=A0A6D2HUD7_9BRAS|nr:unnamed protein product [Microthlaspi erraticum]
MKELALPLKGYMESFRRKIPSKYEEGKVDVLRKNVLSGGKEHASLCAKALKEREVEERLNKVVEKLELVFQLQGMTKSKFSYDLLHLDGLFAYESQRCEMNNVMLKMEAATVLIQTRIGWVTEKKIRDRETLFISLIKLLLLFNGV